MKLKLLVMIILFSINLLAQYDRLKLGLLTTGDSTVTFYSAGKEWVEIFLMDSSSTADSCVVERQTPINDNWITIGVKDQVAETFVSILSPGVSTTGRLYIVWMMYPGKIRLRKTDVHNISERISYGIQAKGISN